MPTSFRPKRAGGALAASLLLLTLACGNDPLAPFEPEIGNAPDSFQFQVTALRDVTTTREYLWQNAGTVANVNQATALSEGSALLVVRDAGGVEVYRRDLTANGTFQTAVGTAGQWRIRVELARASGAVNFRLQKP